MGHYSTKIETSLHENILWYVYSIIQEDLQKLLYEKICN